MVSGKTNIVMTPDEYRALRVQYGPDVGAWPEGERVAVDAFLNTQIGQQVCAQETGLDALLTDVRKEAEKDCGNPADFLAALSVIPEQHSQSKQPAEPRPSNIWQVISEFLDRLLSPKALFSPAGFASQGAAFAVLLFAGVLVGLNAPANSDSGGEYNGDNLGYDLTESLFGGDANVYSFEE